MWIWNNQKWSRNKNTISHWILPCRMACAVGQANHTFMCHDVQNMLTKQWCNFSGEGSPKSLSHQHTLNLHAYSFLICVQVLQLYITLRMSKQKSQSLTWFPFSYSSRTTGFCLAFIFPLHFLWSVIQSKILELVLHEIVTIIVLLFIYSMPASFIKQTHTAWWSGN